MDFVTHLKKYLSDKEIDDLIASFKEDEVKGLLLNINKMDKDKFLKMYPNLKVHPVIDYAFLYKKDEYNFGQDILHELGAYYIQDPSAMLVSYFLNPKEDDLVFDMCAAPGGKSVGASLLMHKKGLLISNDNSYSRLNILLSNVERMGLTNVSIISNDFSKNGDKYIGLFDKIILDAPCSGSGMFRKLSEMKDDWTYNKVLKYALIQKELILKAYDMLKEGGELIYSTCSYSYEEDEEVIEYLLSNRDALLVDLEHFEGEYRSKKYKETIHLFSSRFTGEGHYIAKIKKPGENKKTSLIKEKYEKSILSKGGNKEIMVFDRCLLPKDLSKYAIREGLFLGTKIKDKFIPSHAYAKSLFNDENMFEVSLEDASKIIKGEEINVNKNDGYYYPSYLGLSIGVLHYVNGRIKNLYPKGLRKNIIYKSSR